MKNKTLYGPDGRPVSTKDLSRELAHPTLAGVRNPWQSSIVLGLTPVKLAAILERGANIDNGDYLTLAEEMEEKDPHYAAVLGTRKRAISGLDVNVEAASDDKKDQDLAEAIRDLTAAPQFGSMVVNLLDALGKGYSVCEIDWQTQGGLWSPRDYKWRDPHFFTFDQESGSQLRLIDETDMHNGIPLMPYKFIVHQAQIKSGLPVRDGLARLVAWSFIFKNYSLKDWVAFCEVFGMPMRIGRYGPNTSDEDRRTLFNAVVGLGADAAAIIPDSMRIDFEQAAGGRGGHELFEKFADWLDRQISKAVLGQTMTTDDGSSYSQAQVHNEVRIDVLKSDAKNLANTLNYYLVRAYIDLNFGPQERYPRIVFPVPEPEDLTALVAAIEKLVPLGLPVSKATMLDKLGLPEPAAGAELLQVPGTTPTSEAPEQKSPNRKLAKALNSQQTALNITEEEEEEESSDWEQTLPPVLDPLQALADKSASYEEFLAGLPGLLAEMDSTKLIESLALATFEARIRGDQDE